MPKFHVTFERTHTERAETDVEAETQTQALNIAEEMVEHDKVEGWSSAGAPATGVAAVDAIAEAR
jgi:hypothetical protein